MKALGLALLVLIAAWTPLCAPADWVHHGAFPDIAMIVVVFAALRTDADHAALLGVAIGAVAGVFTVEPFGQQALLLGTTGYVAGRLRRTVFRDRPSVQVIFVALAVFAVRVLDAAAAEFVLARSAETARASAWSVSAFAGASRARDAALSGIHGFDTLTVMSSALLAALGSALAALPLFSLLRTTRALAPFEHRVARRV